MALYGINNFENEDYVSVLDMCAIYYPDEIAPGVPHPKAGEIDVPASEANGATVFVIGALTVAQRAYVTDKTGVVQETDQEGGTRLIHRNGTKVVEACRFGIRDWRHFLDPSGNEIKITRVDRIITGETHKVLADDTLRQLGVVLWSEIGERILERNNFVQSLAKNLNGRVQQSPSFPSTTVAPVSPISKNGEDAHEMSASEIGQYHTGKTAPGTGTLDAPADLS